MKPQTIFYIILFLVVMGTLNAEAQAPKQHIFYDTIKTVKERIDFSPDTIPVYFKELIIKDDITEHWVSGFVIWKTYRKINTASTLLGGYYSEPDYIKVEFTPTITDNHMFLYSDRRTKVTNKVIFSIKR